jgi:hypothetical protein
MAVRPSLCILTIASSVLNSALLATSQTFTSLPVELLTHIFTFVLLQFGPGYARGRERTVFTAEMVRSSKKMHMALQKLLYEDVSVRSQDAKSYASIVTIPGFRQPRRLYIQFGAREEEDKWEGWHDSLLPFLLKRASPTTLVLKGHEKLSLLDVEAASTSTYTLFVCSCKG